MIKKTFWVLVLSLIPSISFAAETMAKSRIKGWTLSVFAEGSAWEKSCKLKLVAETSQFKHEISLKRKGLNCALYSPVQLYATETPDHKFVTIFLEAARGGDGDHSGPIVEVYKLSKESLKKLGEQELFEANYHCKGEQITSVTGTVLYSLCESCDGPDCSDPADNFYIPSIIKVDPAGISVRSTLSKQDRKALLKGRPWGQDLIT